MRIKAIIFDFDGVILESVSVKTEAFRKLFENYPEHVDDILQFHVENGGMSRFKKFEIIYRDMLRKPLTDEESQRLGEKFTEYCYEGVLQSPYVLGALEFLKKYSQRLLFFVASGTPEEEVRKIVEEKGLSSFFKEVYGSPRSKAELNALILEEYELDPHQALFVGDAVNDLEGALEAGVEFIGRQHALLQNPFPDLPENRLIKDLNGLDKMIESHNIQIL